MSKLQSPQRNILFKYELVLLCLIIVFAAMVMIAEFPIIIRLGAAALILYVGRKIVLHLTDSE